MFVLLYIPMLHKEHAFDLISFQLVEPFLFNFNTRKYKSI